MRCRSCVAWQVRATLRDGCLRSLRRGTPAAAIFTALRDEAMELDSTAQQLLTSANVYRAAAPRMYGAVGALNFVVDYKAENERTAEESEWDTVVEECNVGLEQDSGSGQLRKWRAAALRALDECERRKRANILKTEAEGLAVVGAAWEGAVQVGRVGRREQLASEAALSLVEELAAVPAKDAGARISALEAETGAALAEAERVLGLCGGAEEVLQAARDAQCRLQSVTAAVALLNELWDAFPKASVVVDPTKEETTLYEAVRAAGLDQAAALAANASAEIAAHRVLEQRSQRAEALGRTAALENLRGCLSVAEKSPGAFDQRLWRQAVDELRRAVEVQSQVGSGLLLVGTCSVVGQKALLAESHTTRGQMLALYSTLGGAKLHVRAEKSLLLRRMLTATGTACGAVADAKAYRIGRLRTLRQQHGLMSGADPLSAPDGSSQLTAVSKAEKETEEALLAIENRGREAEEARIAKERKGKEEEDVRAAEARLEEAEATGDEEIIAAARLALEEEKAEAVEAAEVARREAEEAEAAKEDAAREAAEAAKARDAADAERELSANVPEKAQHVLAKRELGRAKGAQDFVNKTTIQLWATPHAVDPYPEDAALEEMHKARPFTGFLSGERRVEFSVTRNYMPDVVQCARSYGMMARTKRLLFIARVGALDRPWLEGAELAACKALIDDLRSAGEELIVAIEELHRLEAEYATALEWQAEAAAADDIAEEDAADHAVADLSEKLFASKLAIERNTANAELYREMMVQVNGRLGRTFKLDQGEKDLLKALDKQAEVRVAAEEIQGRRREAIRSKKILERQASTAKSEKSRFEYQLKRAERDMERARMGQDADGYRAFDTKCSELRSKMQGLQKTMDECGPKIRELDAVLDRIELENTDVKNRVEEVAAMKKAADEEVGKGWAASLQAAINKAESVGSTTMLGRLRCKEVHRDIDGAVNTWKHVKEKDKDPTLAVEVLRTCLCATHDETMETLVRKTVERWLDSDIVAALRDADPSNLPGGAQLKQAMQLLFASAMLSLLKGEFVEAKQTLLLLMPKVLGSSFSDIIAHGDVGTYGVICVLATFDGAGEVHKMLHNRRFAPFLRKAPKAKELAAELYAGNYGRVMAAMAAIDVDLHLDVFISAHRAELMSLIHSNAQRICAFKRPFAPRASLFEAADFTGVDGALGQAVGLAEASSESRRLDKARKHKTISDLQSAVAAYKEAPSVEIRRLTATLTLGKLCDESVECYQHARGSMHAAAGAIAFIEDRKCAMQTQKAESEAAVITKDDEPRQFPSELQREISLTRLFTALRDVGYSAGLNASRLAAQQRLILTSARRSGARQLLDVIQEVEQLMLAAEAAEREKAEAQAAQESAWQEAEQARLAQERRAKEEEDVRAAEVRLEEAEATGDEVAIATARHALEQEVAEAAHAAEIARREAAEAEAAKADADREAAEAAEAARAREAEGSASGGEFARATLTAVVRKLEAMQSREGVGSDGGSDPLGQLREAREVIEGYRRVAERAKGVMWFVGADKALKAEEEAKVRLLKQATERAQAQFRTRASGMNLRRATKEAGMREADREKAQKELYAALKYAEELGTAAETQLAQVLAKKDAAFGASFAEMKKLGKEIFELESSAAIANAKAERAKAHALGLQDIYDNKRALALQADNAKKEAQEAHAAAQAQTAGENKDSQANSVINLFRVESGRVDEYGRQLNMLTMREERHVARCDANAEEAEARYQIVSETCRAQAYVEGQASMAAWLTNKLSGMRVHVGQSRKHEVVFRKVRKVTQGIINRQILARRPEKELYYSTPARRAAQQALLAANKASQAADEVWTVAEKAVADAPAVAMKAEIVEIDKKLTKVVYQADRAFRAVKDNTKKGLQKQLALDQALLDELRSEESVLRDRRAELEEALVEGEVELLALRAKLAEAEEGRLAAEAARNLAQAELDAALKVEHQAQARAKGYLVRAAFVLPVALCALADRACAPLQERLEGEGIVFAAGEDEATVGEYKNRFKDLLMRKTLDGQLDTPWSADDEREFRTKFTEGLGGMVRKSEAAADLRAKESSLVARLGGYT